MGLREKPLFEMCGPILSAGMVHSAFQKSKSLRKELQLCFSPAIGHFLLSESLKSAESTCIGPPPRILVCRYQLWKCTLLSAGPLTLECTGWSVPPRVGCAGLSVRERNPSPAGLEPTTYGSNQLDSTVTYAKHQTSCNIT